MNFRPPRSVAEEGQAAESLGPVAPPQTLSDHAREAMVRRRGERLFSGDWTGATFLHFEAEARLLGEVVPFPLDLHEGRAYISLVAFTMRRFRPAVGGRAAAWLTAPLATQRFLNLRTYVRGSLGPGIFFMHEWLDHPLAVRLGRPGFGLPYRRGRLSYQNNRDLVSGRVAAGADEGFFSGRLTGWGRTAARGSRDEFLLERYTAYTAAGFRPLAFRVWHEPWSFRALEPDENTMAAFLRALRQPWTATLHFAGAVFSEGVRGVWMGRPRAA